MTSEERRRESEASEILKSKIEWWVKLAGGKDYEDFNKVLEELSISGAILTEENELSGFCNTKFVCTDEKGTRKIHLYAPRILEIEKNEEVYTYLCDFSKEQILRLFAIEYRDKNTNFELQTVLHTNGGYYGLITDIQGGLVFECILVPKSLNTAQIMYNYLKIDRKKMEEELRKLIKGKNKINCEVIANIIKSTITGKIYDCTIHIVERAFNEPEYLERIDIDIYR